MNHNYCSGLILQSFLVLLNDSKRFFASRKAIYTKKWFLVTELLVNRFPTRSFLDFLFDLVISYLISWSIFCPIWLSIFYSILWPSFCSTWWSISDRCCDRFSVRSGYPFFTRSCDRVSVRPGDRFLIDVVIDFLVDLVIDFLLNLVIDFLLDLVADFLLDLFFSMKVYATARDTGIA